MRRTHTKGIPSIWIQLNDECIVDSNYHWGVIWQCHRSIRIVVDWKSVCVVATNCITQWNRYRIDCKLTLMRNMFVLVRIQLIIVKAFQNAQHSNWKSFLVTKCRCWCESKPLLVGTCSITRWWKAMALRYFGLWLCGIFTWQKPV